MWGQGDLLGGSYLLVLYSVQMAHPSRVNHTAPWRVARWVQRRPELSRALKAAAHGKAPATHHGNVIQRHAGLRALPSTSSSPLLPPASVYANKHPPSAPWASRRAACVVAAGFQASCSGSSLPITLLLLRPEFHNQGGGHLLGSYVCVCYMSLHYAMHTYECP